MPRTIQNILETGQVQLCRLLDKTSPSNPPQTHKTRIHNTTHSGGNVKNRTKQSSHRSSSIKCSESEHLRGCDDLAVYGTRMPPDHKANAHYEQTQRGRQLPAVTGCYRQLLAVTDSYRQLPAGTGRYRQLPAVTGSYRQLPAVTYSYRQVQAVTG